ncbi:MAG: hypothetical protein MZW92_79115 [Comamonadaceae bacterium]|nr:hypothetical protein [Comamonadaceae bacterium]
MLMVSAQPEPDRHRRWPGPGPFADMGLGFLSWNWLPLLPMFVVYFIAGVAETNRAPVRRGRGRVARSSPASHDRVLGHGVRGVLPRRVRQHDPGRRR